MAVAIAASVPAVRADGPYADLVLHRGTIITVDDRHGEVQALAVTGDRISAVGTNGQIEAWIGPATRVIDLEGRFAFPGFIEGHGHFVSMGYAKMRLDLMKVRSWDEVIDLVAEAAAGSEAGQWIEGRGWHQEKWDRPPDEAVEGFPVHDRLSAVSPDNPVLLTHASGHACCGNKLAMDLAGISGATTDPPGGEILRDEAGEPIGIFRETAQRLLAAARARDNASPAQQAAQLDRAIDLAVQECLANGITTFQDAGSDFQTIDALVRRAESGTLGVRLWIMVREPNEQLDVRLDQYATLRRIGDDRLTVGGLKRTLDGALGARGAWLLEPYSDKPDSTGLETAPLEDIAKTAHLAMEHRLQMCVHAIGDRANRETLDLFERIFAEHPERPGMRWRIEHAQHLHPDDIPRFGRLGVIAAMQGVHCTSDGPWVIARLGEQRARDGAYVWQKLMRSGAVIANGTDAPVEDVDPIASYAASVSRRMPDGKVFYGSQCMSRAEALRSYTINNAYAAFEEDIKGSLSPGKLADITVLSRNIVAAEEQRILGTEVLYTIVGGQILYAGEPGKVDP
jgi:predicted amidohydrolase YtcJ